jgi:hypothetical protein
MVSRLKQRRFEMNTLNTETTDLRTLSDLELNDVTGGICWWKVTLIVIGIGLSLM